MELFLTSTAEGSAVVKHVVCYLGCKSKSRFAFRGRSCIAQPQCLCFSLCCTTLSKQKCTSEKQDPFPGPQGSAPSFLGVSAREKLLIAVGEARYPWEGDRDLRCSTVQPCDCSSGRPEQGSIRLTSWVPATLPWQ